MEQELKELIFAALFHDIGKLIERTEKTDFSANDESIFKYSHASSTYTFLNEFFRDNTTTNLAARHHNPTAFTEWIIAKADRHAAGHERYPKGPDDEIRTGKEKRPLQSVIERIKIKDLGIQKPRNSFMPGKISAEGIYAGKHDEELFMERYKGLREDLIHEIKVFNDKLGKAPCWEYNNAYRSMMLKYLWSVPDSARKEELPDVSLYEHSRITAILAACLYRYHKHHGTEGPEQVQSDSEKKYLLTGADISGIQKFIFNIGSKGAYKNLKGRSFFMQLLPYLIARRILDAVDMDENQIVYLTGGHFYLMLPNTEKVREAVNKTFEDVNLELYRDFEGGLFVRGDYHELSPQELMNKDFRRSWDDLFQKLSFKDNNKYSGTACDNYETLFRPVNGRDADFRELGEYLRDGKDIIFISRDASGGTDAFLGYRLDFNDSFDGKGEIAIVLNLEKVPGRPVDFIYMLIGGLSGFNRDFDEVAKASKGSHLLGTLRMDVDNLGMIFREGFKDYCITERQPVDHFSISRITTLSTQLIMFFSIGIDAIIRDLRENYGDDRDEKAVVVYSGGDDLFIIGRWDVIPDLAIRIREKFSEFACGNPCFTLSAGVALTPGKYPVYRAADHAGDAEDAAKSYSRGKKKKDAICFMGAPFDWSEFKMVKDNYIDELMKLDEADRRPVVRRINLVAWSYEKLKNEKRRRNRMKDSDIKKLIEAERWQWLMVYSFSRLKSRSEGGKFDEFKKALQLYFAGKDKNDIQGIERAEVIGKWTENLTRKL
ncbi:MAG TPA: type III-A CRISPR-associated protein Cas10/Csm1 [Spirochaetota bacterium]|nr:type III-A CRISPR-associated protein Cas10/Csm1 [Spirochaetota bacterium]